MDMKTSTPAAAAFPATELQTGDILLMLGEGPLSELIAWASDGAYSHAAIVADGGDLIEAAASGVRRYPLAQRLGDQANYHFIDALRVHDRAGAPLTAVDLGQVLAQAQTMLGVPYPVDQLALLGVVMAVRGKWPVHPWGRLLVRVALDHALPDDDGRMVCSEVVYRAYAECAAVPAGRLAPEIVIGPRGTAPFPEIDWKALFDEVWPLLRPGGRETLHGPRMQVNAMKSVDLAGAGAAGAEQSVEPVSDDMLEQARQAVLARAASAVVAPRGVGDALPAADALPDATPNPRLVSPEDLAISPSVTRLGRLMQRAMTAT
ncbi:hypothetical protein [Luteimonas kalidii]|uniref:Uncharacterized protein n=1 Tax=Luteimonas kalidii TaxID=3042025 RepID=A0ABT6JTZ4_9GAMM|nr:hypothetical protein [Luteimonas kalidii]MDH5834153.1 hypothetical protein [Luteimonas kalidii]